MARVLIPPPLRSYTAERAEAEARGASLAEVLADLDARFPGLRFRIIDEQDTIRTHIRIFVNRRLAHGIATPVGGSDTVLIVCALSGG